MAIIAGAQANAAIQVATTWGTEVAAGAGDKLVAKITDSANEQELIANQVASGVSFATAAVIGNTKPSGTIDMDVGYRNGADTIIAQIFGTDTPSAEITGGQGDYRHVITFNTTLNGYGGSTGKFLSIARESTSAKTINYPTCAIRKISLSTPTVPGYFHLNAEFIANKIELASAVNTNAVTAAATSVDTALAAVDFSDSFWINAQAGGSLSSSDKLNVLNFTFDFERPQDMPNEIRGAAGNSVPISTGLPAGTLSVTLSQLTDHTYLTAWEAGTEYKLKYVVDGAAIGSGSNKSYSIYCPRLILINKPQVDLTEDGVNQVTMVFRMLKAASNPTGMTSTYPYVEIINAVSTNILA